MGDNKYCVVPSCKNTTLNSNSEKLFFHVPKHKRKKWLEAVGRSLEHYSKKTVLFICEEHFDIEDDMENYVQFKMMGGRKRLKPNVIPHKFCKPEESTSLTWPSQNRQNEQNVEKWLQEANKTKLQAALSPEVLTEIKEETIDIKEELIEPNIDISNELILNTINSNQESKLLPDIKTECSDIEPNSASTKDFLPVPIKTEVIDDPPSEIALEPVATVLLPLYKSENFIDENEDNPFT